jgi:diacylglycerol kinase family enzyme
MQRVWFISNSNSGTATRESCEALEAVLQKRQLVLVGRTLFPDEALPESLVLEADQVDTVVLFAGDGTINAALCRLAEWPGSFLILPGGTMNLLAKALHADLDPTAIIHAAHTLEQRVSLPYVEAGSFRAFVGVIIGPGASWVRAREAARIRRYVRMWRGMRLAWRRTFGDGVQIEGVRQLQRGYQAVFVTPETGALRVAAVAARDWGAITELGWSFVTGDWMRARAVDTATVQRLRISDRKRVMALFDGEPEMLDPDTQITSGLSRKVFLTTKEAT